MSEKKGDLVRVRVQLDRDESDHPPADYEHLWARITVAGLYELDNIPFFAKGLRVQDLFSAESGEGGELIFSRVVCPSRHATLRVIVFRESPDKNPLETRVVELRSALSQLGCSTELSHIPGLLAVDVPEGASLSLVTKALSDGERSELWEYEEAALPRQGDPKGVRD